MKRIEIHVPSDTVRTAGVARFMFSHTKGTQMTEPNAYALAGVDVDVEAEASRIMYEASRETWSLRKGRVGEIIVPFDDFSGIKGIRADGFPKGSFLNIGADGTGTKGRIHQRLKTPETLGIDLVAMVADDAVQKGAEPIAIVNVLDVTTLGTDGSRLPIIRGIAKGLVAGCRTANVGILNGEIAQIGMSVGGYGEMPFNWSAACLWLFREEKVLTGAKIRSGDSIVAFREQTPRCNGYSLIDRNFRGKYGDEWHLVPFGDSTLGAAAALPSRICTPAIVAAHGGFDTEGECEIHGVAHITGGGIPEKMGRLLRPTGLGALLFDPYEMPPVMLECQRAGNTSDRDMYRAFNAGHAMAVVVPIGHADALIACARRFGIEAKVAGTIVEAPGIRIMSRGLEAPGTELQF